MISMVLWSRQNTCKTHKQYWFSSSHLSRFCDLQQNGLIQEMYTFDLNLLSISTKECHLPTVLITVFLFVLFSNLSRHDSAVKTLKQTTALWDWMLSLHQRLFSKIETIIIFPEQSQHQYLYPDRSAVQQCHNYWKQSASPATQAKSCWRSCWTDWSHKQRRLLLKNR